MNKGIIFGLVMLAFGNANAQEKKAENDSLPPFEIQRNVFIYNVAKKFNDIPMQKSALYNLLSYNPSNIGLLDSIALLYYSTAQYASAALVSQDIIKILPNDMLATEIAALSFENLGVKDRALTYYESLYLNNNDIGVLYQIAFLQFDLKRYNEAITNTDIILKDPIAESRVMVFPNSSNTMDQQVSMKAATYRLMAMIEEEKGNIDKAKGYFNKCLEFAPNFDVVKVQLKNLN